MTYLHPHAIVSTDWLGAHLDDPDLRIFDCTFYLHYGAAAGQPYTVESGRAGYEDGHIPGAGFLDLQEEFSVADSPYRFTLMTPDETAKAFAAKGISDDTRVVLYSRDSVQRATRFWWMLRWLGFDNAALLDGGFVKWQAEGRPVSTEPCRYAPAALSVDPRPALFVGKDAVRDAIGDPRTSTINALGKEFHSGANPAYGRPGHIPGSVNVPSMDLVDPQTTELLPAEKTAQMFADAGADQDKKIIAYCGGGIAATLDAFVLHQLGYTDIAVYDDSMSEWAKDPDLPIETD